MKKAVLYYSDCKFFGGSENMLVNFLESDLLHNKYKLTFIYRKSFEYDKGLSQRVNSIDYNKIPIHLITLPKLDNKDKIPFLLKPFVLLFWGVYIILFKYYSIFHNVIILYKKIKNMKIDLVHINNGGYPAAHSCYSMVIAAKLNQVSKIVYVVNNLAQNYIHPLRWLDYPLDIFIKKSVTIFITGSNYAGDILKKVLMLKKEKQFTIHNGIKIRPITLDNISFRKKYHIPVNRPLLSMIALLEKRKGHIYLLKALSSLKDENPKLLPYTIFEGDGEERQHLDKFIDQNNLQENIRIVPFIPNIFNLINASDIICVPSIGNEDFPNIVLEAMSLGKPVIGTNIAGIPEQIDDQKTGLIIKAQNYSELKSSIIELTSSKTKRDQFSINAKKRFDNNFIESVSVANYINLYKTLEV